MRTVLLADDNRECLRTLSRVLQRFGLRTLPAAHVDEARWLLERAVVDLAILDLEMPRVGGLQLMRLIHRHRPRLPVVILSGVDTKRIAIRSFAAGAYAFLLKPVEIEMLRQMLSEVLASAPPAVYRKTVTALRRKED